MPDFGPGSKIRPKALIIQLDPFTSEMVEAALHFDVELPSGKLLFDAQHWWKEATPAQRARAHDLAQEAITDVTGVHELVHSPTPPESSPR